MDARTGQVELILSRLDTLPTLPAIASRLLEISSDERIDLKEVSAMIETDPALSARVLATCRRAELGLGDRITTVRRAVVMLGLDAVRSAVLSVCIFDLMNKEARRVSGEAGDLGSFDLDGYWKHALGVACASERIARDIPAMGVQPDEGFIAGLLHDFGRLALAVALPRAMQQAQELACRRGMDAAEVEREIIGLDHSIAGKRLGEHWGLPDSISRVIWLNGQEPEAIPHDEHRGLIVLVRWARALCRELHVGASGDFGDLPDWRGEALAMGRDPAPIERVGKLLHARVAERCKALGVCDELPPTMMLDSIARANESLGRLVDRLGRRRVRDQQCAEALASIDAFHDRLGRQPDLESTLGAIVEHAGERYASDSWLVAARDDGVSLAIAYKGGVDLWLEADERLIEGVLAPLRDGAQIAPLSLSTSDAIGEILGRPGRLMRSLRLVGGDSWIVLVGEALPREIGGVDATIVPVWERAACSAQRFERDRAMSERLAEANMRVASMQAARAREESMRHLGEMTAGAAHEMNNPLTRISGQAQRLLMRLEGEDRAMGEDVVEAAHELSELVTSLHLLAEPARTEMEELDVREVLGRSADLGRAIVGTDGEVEIICGVVRVESDGDVLAGAVSELVANALQAVETSGVEIRAETVGADGRLRIVVSDSGCGLSERARRHAFDPFFSERDAGRGRGLGLCRARRLVEALGGRIGIVEREGGGTEAWIELPATKSATAWRASA